jgi:hypothetical protein
MSDMTEPWPTPLPSPQSGQDQLPQRPRLSRAAARADLVACAVLAGGSVAAGFGVGALWRATSPAVLGIVSQGAAYLAAPEGKTFVARDGWFAVYACVAAALLAVFAFFRYRGEGSTGAAIALAGGGVAGGYLAAWFGGIIGPGHGSLATAVRGVKDGATFSLPVTLRATGVIWLWPAVAAGLFFFLILLFGPADPELEPEQQLFPGWVGENGYMNGASNAAISNAGPAAAGFTDVGSGGDGAQESNDGGAGRAAE